MEWRDTGILLSTRKHGENSLILEVFTPEHGRHLGVLRGGTSRKMAPYLQPGAQLDLTWKARLEDHMGAFTAEPERSRAAMALGHRIALAGLNTTLALLTFCLPEREAHRPLYNRSEALLDLLGQPDLWPLAYLRWELALLEELGFGLDLTRCAATGSTEDLAYVSPKSGRAVSRAGAGEWADRMLPLPDVLLGKGAAPDREIVTALQTTGFFLEHRLAPQLSDRPLPAARSAFLDLLARQSQRPA
ncbi:DNA repair protein RecO [Primorskyibacter sp. 2E233]|uniref:DNA repair protein RecO n=1 Tax=Primorskyibacter sp. 2E233 TaxID=3413431 RepID=UPI003BF19959